MKTVLHIPHALAAFAGALAVAGMLSMSGPAGAVPVQFGTNNYYEFVFVDDGGDPNNGISWASANTAAAGMSHLGFNGHLATVTSAAENAFLAGLVAPFASFSGSWLGGTENKWVVGPEAGQLYSYINFAGIEPNNAPSNAYMNIGGDNGPITFGKWADAAGGTSDGGDPIKGFFVEYEVNAVPLPAALPLFATGLGVIGLLGWRRKRKNAAAIATA